MLNRSSIYFRKVDMSRITVVVTLKSYSNLGVDGYRFYLRDSEGTTFVWETRSNLEVGDGETFRASMTVCGKSPANGYVKVKNVKLVEKII